MTQCELCGNDVENLLETKISGAILNVCPDCTDHGMITDKQKEKDKTENKTKYSTSKTSNNTNTKPNNNTSNVQQHNTNNSNKQDDENYFEDVNDLSLNYGVKIQQARDKKGFTRKEFANKLNIKESHLKNIEDESTQPSIKLQNKLEKTLNIDLSVEDIDY